MKVKPHGTWFILPIGLLFVSGVIAVIFFFQAVISPVMNVMDTNLNQVYDEELTAGSFISLYFDETDVIDYAFVEDDGDFIFQYETAQGHYTIQVEILRVAGGTESTGFSVITFDDADAYTVDEYKNFADVNIDEDGTYRVIYSSYDDINVGFGLQFADWSDYGVKILVSIISLVIGLPASIISFIVIIVMRSNSKKKNNENTLDPHIDPVFLKKEEQKEKADVDKHFDY